MSLAMDSTTAQTEVDELLLGPNSILVELRSLQGLDPTKYSRLVTAIHTLIDHYKGKTEVPKRLAVAFIDISNYFYYTEDEYPKDQLDRLEDAAHELTYLADKLFS